MPNILRIALLPFVTAQFVNGICPLWILPSLPLPSFGDFAALNIWIISLLVSSGNAIFENLSTILHKRLLAFAARSFPRFPAP